MNKKLLGMGTIRLRENWLYGLLFLTYLISLFININCLPLHFEEPRRALVALEMVISGNYFVPTINGEIYLNKLPLFIWVIILFTYLFNSWDNWVVRLPTILSFVLIGVIIYSFAKKYLNQKTALFASLFWLTTMDIFYRFSILAEIDVFYVLIVIIQVVSIFHFYQRGNLLLLFLISYVFMTLGVFTKGLPSLAVQGLTLVGFMVVTKDYKSFFSWPHVLGLMASGLLLFSYFYQYAQFENPVPLMLRQLSESSGRTLVEGNFWLSIRHLFLFPFTNILTILPWGVFLIFLVRKEIREKLMQDKLLAFSILFIAFNILPYWFSAGTRARYLYFFIPFVMIICSWLYVRFYSKERLSRVINIVFILFIVVLIIASAALPFIDLLKGIPFLVYISLLFVSVFCLLLVAFIKMKPHRIPLFIFVLVIARIFFDVVVIPGRHIEFTQNGLYSNVMEDIFSKTGDNPIKIVTGVKKLQYDLPFGLRGEYEETEWPFFGLSYLYSKKHHQVLEIADELNPGEFYVGRVDYVRENWTEIIEIKEYHVSNWNEDYLLFQIKN